MALKLLLISIVALLLSVSQVCAQAGLVLNEEFNGFAQTGGVGGGTVTTTEPETYNKNGGCYRTGVDGYDSFSSVPDPCDAGNNTLQVTNIMGDGTENCNNNWDVLAGQACADPNGCFPNTHRAEIISNDNNKRPDDGEEYWVGWRIWVPTNFPAQITESLIVFQGICPPNDGTDWDLRVHNNGQWRFGKRRTLANFPRQDTIIDFAPIQRGTWNNFVVRWKRAIDATGQFQFWYNGVQKMIIANAITAQSNQPACIVKQAGIYRGGKIPLSSAGKNYTLLFDSVKVAFGANHFNTVAPTTDPGVCEDPTDPDPPVPGTTNFLLGASPIFYD